MLKKNKITQARQCLEGQQGNIGLLRLRKLVKDTLGIVDEDRLTQWLWFMLDHELIEEISVGQFRITYKQQITL